MTLVLSLLTGLGNPAHALQVVGPCEVAGHVVAQDRDAIAAHEDKSVLCYGGLHTDIWWQAGTTSDLEAVLATLARFVNRRDDPARLDVVLHLGRPDVAKLSSLPTSVDADWKLVLKATPSQRYPGSRRIGNAVVHVWLGGQLHATTIDLPHVASVSIDGQDALDLLRRPECVPE